MTLTDRQLSLTYQILLVLAAIDCIYGESDDLLTGNSSLVTAIPDRQNDREDIIVLSSWNLLKYWTTHSSLHLSQTIDDLYSNKSNDKKITAIDFYVNEKICQNVMIWSDLTARSIFSSTFTISDQYLNITQTKQLLSMNFGSHLRLAIDSLNQNIYLALYDFSRIDIFNINTKVTTNLLSNISHPVDIAVDSKRQILFWVENWTCICQTSLTLIKIIKFCSLNARTIALDPIESQLYWSDLNGNIFRRNYFEKTTQLVISTKKMQQNFALDVTNNAIYLSDSYKLMSIQRSTLNTKVVIIESQPILDFKAIETHYLCRRDKTQPLDRTRNNSVFINETISNVIFMNQSLIDREKSYNNNNKTFLVSTTFYIIIMFQRLFDKKPIKRNKVKTISRLFRNQYKRRLLNEDSLSKSVYIEDLGSFGNNGYLDSKQFCMSCPIRQTCNSCQDRDECLEKGICMKTYKLLSD
ncbi:uncharacterized protein LOC128965530 [Oppia nitens]|uniref:uncharacterized protein LOC128965530 n=1 Tax=Oppia nitens TaxID=1686743 RepID=UPI0023DCE30A|nr:uncharacterized protein LOC128965530 [Oppia nitens]